MPSGYFTQKSPKNRTLSLKAAAQHIFMNGEERDENKYYLFFFVFVVVRIFCLIDWRRPLGNWTDTMTLPRRGQQKSQRSPQEEVANLYSTHENMCFR